METIDDRIKRVNSKYEAPESIDERIKRANDKYQWDSSDKEMHDWFESTGRTTRSANSRLQNSSYANWKRDSENTKSAVNNDLEKADRIKSYLDSQREQLGEERYKVGPSGLRKTMDLANSLAHRTTWLRSDFRLLLRYA